MQGKLKSMTSYRDEKQNENKNLGCKTMKNGNFRRTFPSFIIKI